LPELPEVEITRRHLEQAMTGRAFAEVTVTHPRTARHNSSPEEVESRLRGRRVVDVGRKGKFLVLSLHDGQSMVAHLGMSGRFAVSAPDEEKPAHTHFVARLDDGSEVRFIDPRTFGFVAALDEEEIAHSGVARLGPDAWGERPDANALAERLRGRTAPIKALLLDQGPISGLGNIYADEALHRAAIHPLTPAGALGLDRLGALSDAIVQVLDSAIEEGGTTLGDLAYLLPDGRAGENLSSLRVYGREGLPCPACGTPVERVVIRARSSSFCPRCQRT
jgi:formamidopyrimidine-DNA glycosylase